MARDCDGSALVDEAGQPEEQLGEVGADQEGGQVAARSKMMKGTGYRAAAVREQR